MIYTKFDKDSGILFSKYSGLITLFEIVEYIDHTKKNTSYPRKLKIISDARDANFSLKPKNLKIIIKENFESLKQYDYIFDAVLVDSPKETALTLLYQELSKTVNYRFDLFISEQRAISWLNSMDLYFNQLYNNYVKHKIG